MGAEGSERIEAGTKAPDLIKHPIVEKNGIQFYEITRYSRDGKSYLSYQPVDGDWVGHGTTRDAPEVFRAAQSLGREAAAQRKAERAIYYEEQMYGALDAVARLQTSLVQMSNDPDAQPTREDMEKWRLGLQAAESILNRALGKAVSKVDMDVTHRQADEIATYDAEWVVEE